MRARRDEDPIKYKRKTYQAEAVQIESNIQRKGEDINWQDARSQCYRTYRRFKMDQFYGGARK
jgi:hypothetical protein